MSHYGGGGGGYGGGGGGYGDRGGDRYEMKKLHEPSKRTKVRLQPKLIHLLSFPDLVSAAGAGAALAVADLVVAASAAVVEATECQI